MSPILKARLPSSPGSMTRTRDMTRSEAAQYITSHWFPCSPKTLAKLAVIGGGPAFRKAGRVPLYSPSACDDYGRSKIGPLVYSTAELSVAKEARASGPKKKATRPDLSEPL